MPNAQKVEQELYKDILTICSEFDPYKEWFQELKKMNKHLTVSYTHLTLPTNREV